MADYYPLIAKAVAGLDKSTSEARRALYDRARTALLAQLRGGEPALSESDITRERMALEEAIRKVEGEVAFQRAPDAGRRQLPRGEAPSDASQEFDYGPRAARPADDDDQMESEDTRHAAPLSAAATARADSEVRRGERWSPGGSSSLSDNALRSFRESIGDTGPADDGSVRTYPDRDLRRFEQGPGQWTDRDDGQDQTLHDQDFQAQDFRGRAPEHAPPLPRLSSRDPARPPVPLGDPDDGRGRALQSFPRIARPERAQMSERVAAERLAPEWNAPRNTNRIVAIAVIALLVLGIAGVAFWFGDDIMSSLHDTSSHVADQAPPADATRGKIAERAPTFGTSESSTAAQRVVLYEEDPTNPNGTQFVGTAIWRTEMVPPAAGQKPDIFIRADIEIPDQKVSVRLSLHRNDDKQLPASHTVEIVFTLPPGFSHGGIADIPGVMVKQGETTRGVVLNGVRVKVMENFFLVGLLSAEAEMQRNVQLLKERSWFDIPIVYSDGRRAIIAVEKGPPGERAFAEAFASWEQQPQP